MLLNSKECIPKKKNNTKIAKISYNGCNALYDLNDRVNIPKTDIDGWLPVHNIR